MHSQTNSRKTHQGGRNRLHLLLFLLVIGLLLLPGVAVPVQLPVHLLRLPEVSATIDSLQFLFCEYNFLSFFIIFLPWNSLRIQRCIVDNSELDSKLAGRTFKKLYVYFKRVICFTNLIILFVNTFFLSSNMLLLDY